MRGTRKPSVIAHHYYYYLLSTAFSLILAGAEKPTALFVFGDSIFDAGNNNYINTPYKGNISPYGETFFARPTGRFTNGRTIPDFISERAKLALIPPYLQPGFRNFSSGANFASGGAGILPETHPGLVIDLRTQLSNFKKVEKQLRRELGGEEEAKAFFSSALFLFSVGGNDYSVAFDQNPSLFRSKRYLEPFVGMLIANLTDVIQEIYEKGGRKFGFVNLWSMGCVPAWRAKRQGCAEELVEASKLHNKALSRTLQNLAHAGLDGFKYSILDFFSFLSRRLDHPSKYGFKEGKMACCGSGPYRGFKTCGKVSESYELCDDPSEFLYFDYVHPTEKAYGQLADLFWDGNSRMVSPYGLGQLFETGK